MHDAGIKLPAADNADVSHGYGEGCHQSGDPVTGAVFGLPQLPQPGAAPEPEGENQHEQGHKYQHANEDWRENFHYVNFLSRPEYLS